MQAFPLWLVIMLDSRRNKVLMVFGTLMAASLLPPVSTSSLDKHKFVPKHRTNQSQPLKGNPQLEFHIKLHALLLWASIGVLMPVGIIIVRMSRRVQGIKMLKALFYAHVIVQFTAILLATAAAVLALMNFENSLNNTHQRIGFVLYILIWLHPLVALVRPQRGIKIRSIWYLLHWLLGTGVCVLGITNIYIGLNAYHEKMSRSVSLWKVLFTAQVCIIAIIYLSQDRWDYMLKQGEILDEQVMPSSHSTSPSSNQKELVVVVPSRVK
ncbi:cytochrome b561 domain-containing protein At2g30890-like [Zingiber officinale]|uniref:cytochrome b561 domain-containing protein At2g30890-like n=1 Tax=Zingiber officinale TaxID=94328 RepID=UPI001C4B347E|nr:cytochrome b561 domain-containing protein At2g30890-like [Zingiber officinale]